MDSSCCLANTASCGNQFNDEGGLLQQVPCFVAQLMFCPRGALRLFWADIVPYMGGKLLLRSQSPLVLLLTLVCCFMCLQQLQQPDNTYVMQC